MRTEKQIKDPKTANRMVLEVLEGLGCFNLRPLVVSVCGAAAAVSSPCRSIRNKKKVMKKEGSTGTSGCEEPAAMPNDSDSLQHLREHADIKRKTPAFCQSPQDPSPAAAHGCVNNKPLIR